MAPDRGYWFRAKRYGWGWGLPLRWQGWAALVGYAVLVGAGIVAFPAVERPLAYLTYLLVVTAVLLAICAIKGEPPRWRWGRD